MSFGVGNVYRPTMNKPKPPPKPKMSKISTVYSEEDETEWDSTDSSPEDTSNVCLKSISKHPTQKKSSSPKRIQVKADNTRPKNQDYRSPPVSRSFAFSPLAKRKCIDLHSSF